MDFAWLVPALCVGAFFFNVVITRWLGPRKHALGAFVSLGATAAAFIVFLIVFTDAAATPDLSEHAHLITWSWFRIDSFTFPVNMVVDWPAIVMLGVVSFLSFLIQFYSVGYMSGHNRFWWFFSVIALFTGAMLTLVIAYNFLILYMAWELVGLCSYLLIGFYNERRSAAEASKKAFVTTRVGDVGFFIAILILFSQTGTFDMGIIFEAATNGEISSGLLTLSVLLLFLGAVGKSGQFPLHVWLPDAMEGPTPVSALIHAATMVTAGVFLVARAYPLFVAAPGALEVVLVVGTFTAIFAGVIALVQPDIKRVLAYSTVSQLGYMMMALGAGAYTAALFHLYTHAFFKALLFLGSGAVIHTMETVLHGRAVSPNDMNYMGGLARRMPITAATFVIGALALAGVFPLAGFWSKDEILAGTLHGGHWVPFLVALVTATLTAFYMFRAAWLTFGGSPRWHLAPMAADNPGDDASVGAQHAAPSPGTPSGEPEGHDEHAEAHREPHEAPWTMWLPLVVIAVFAVIAGWINIPGLYTGFADVVHFGEHHEEAFSLVLALVGTAAALLGILVAVAVYNFGLIPAAILGESFATVYRFLLHKFYFDELYDWVINRILLSVSALTALFDRKIVNNFGVDGSGWLTIKSGALLRYHQTGRIYHYALGFVIGAVLVLLMMTAYPALVEFFQ